ncbi:hypothetical protein CO2235_220015 [Cupriavidus oxalaticus]|uniref:Uncharacterized protein n=1 Tax=Cupriavidus oxalaticus TaxID=96344 RepID=A0A976BDB1_9BURK|nr:hypothetical protein CO2235_220015 [Cupriavidus oxalaticus]
MPAAVSRSAALARTNRSSPHSSSRFLMRCDTALGVTDSSSAARAKLPRRAAASKAISRCRGGTRLNMDAMPDASVRAAARGAEDLARVEDMVGIERVLDHAHQVERILAVLLHQEALLVQPHAVLAGAGAAHRQRAFDDALVDGLGLGHFLRLVRVDQDRHVEIAVADVADDRAGQGGGVQVLLGFGHALGQARDRHAHVGGDRLAAGLELQHRKVGGMARVPQPAAVLGARGPLEALAAVLGGDLLHGLGLLAHAGLGAVEFEEQVRGFRQRQVVVPVDGADRQRVDELHARHRHAQLDGLDHGLHRAAHAGEGAHRGRDRLRLRVEPHRDLGNDAERAFAADEQAGQVIAGRRLARMRAGADHAAIGGHHGQRQHVLAHGAVAHRVGPGRARRAHAAQRRVRARVDREEQPGVLDFLVQLLARDAGLHGHAQVLGLHRQHAVHLRQVQADAAGHGQQVPFQRRAGAVGDQRHAVVVAQARDLGDFVGAVGEHDRIGHRRRERRFIAAMVLAHAGRGGEALAEARREGFAEGGRQGTAFERGGRRGVVHAGLRRVGAARLPAVAFRSCGPERQAGRDPVVEWTNNGILRRAAAHAPLAGAGLADSRTSQPHSSRTRAAQAGPAPKEGAGGPSCAWRIPVLRRDNALFPPTRSDFHF